MEHLDLTPRLADMRTATGNGVTRFFSIVLSPLIWMAGKLALLALLIKNAVSRMIPFLVSFSPSFATSILVFIAFNRMLAFAAPREPARLSWKKMLALRGTAIAILAYPASYLFDVYDGKPIPVKSFCQSMNNAVMMSSAIEIFSVLLEGKVPVFEWGYSQPELSWLFQEIASEFVAGRTKVPKDVAIFSALVAVSQISSHLMGLFRLQRYQLIPSSIMGVLFLLHFVYLQVNGGLLKNIFAYTMLSYIRFGPQVVMLTISAVCWSFYWIAVAFVGDRSKMIARGSFAVNLSSTFHDVVFRMGYGALAASVDKTYLHEAASMHWPLATWLDKVDQSSKLKIDAVAPDGSRMSLHGQPSNPYGNEVQDAPRIDSEDVKSEQAHYAQMGYQTIKWIKSTLQFLKALVLVAYLRARDLIRSVPDRPANAAPPPTLVLCDRIYKSLDTDPANEYGRLLSGATLPEVDDSVDFVPDDGFTDASESELDESDSEYGDDISMCAENILGGAHDDHGVELVSAHMNSERVITRQAYFESLDPNRELMGLISELRTGNDMSKCAICLENPRQVVLWPCRCLALCDDCRLTLSARRFKNCVCCQQRVHSYSKVYIP